MISALLNKYINDEFLLDKLVVNSFVRHYNLNINNGYLARFIAEEKDGLEQDIIMLSNECSLEDVNTTICKEMVKNILSKRVFAETSSSQTF